MRTISLKKAIKFIVSLVLLIPAALEAVSTVNKRNYKADIIETASFGTIVYRPDGTDSTVLCFRGFKSTSEPVAFRVYDHEGGDAYPQNFVHIVNGGKQFNITECKTNPDGTFSRDIVIQCLDKLNTKAPTVASNGKLFVEKVDYSKECEGKAQPKDAKIPPAKRRGYKQGA